MHWDRRAAPVRALAKIIDEQPSANCFRPVPSDATSNLQSPFQKIADFVMERVGFLFEAMPPGRLRLATKPVLTGSLPLTNRIGVVVVAALAACITDTGVPHNQCHLPARQIRR
jgi:hypothetical protein